MKKNYVYLFFGLQVIGLIKACPLSFISFFKPGVASLINDEHMLENVMIVFHLCLITYYIMVVCKKQWIPDNFRLGFSMVQPPAGIGPEKDEPPLKPARRFHVLWIKSDKEFSHHLSSTLSNEFRISILDDFKKIDKETVSQEVDVIIIDEFVGGIYGGDLCARIRKDEKMTDIPVVLLINSIDGESYISHAKCGANRVVCRYTDIRIITADIHMLVSNSSRYREKISKLKTEKIAEAFPDISLKDRKDQEFINQVLELIETYPLSEKYPVKKLAENACMAPTSFYIKVKEVTGESPKKLLTAYKMKKAEELIRKEEYQVTDVALMLGYTDVRYFAKQFKKVYHICPSKYLESIKEDASFPAI